MAEPRGGGAWRRCLGEGGCLSHALGTTVSGQLSCLPPPLKEDAWALGHDGRVRPRRAAGGLFLWPLGSLGCGGGNMNGLLSDDFGAGKDLGNQ